LQQENNAGLTLGLGKILRKVTGDPKMARARKRRRKKPIFQLFIVMIITTLAGWHWAGQTWQGLISPVGTGGLIRVEIPSGTSNRQVGQILADAGLIRSTFAWQLWTRTAGRNWILKAGTYDLSPAEDMVSLADHLQRGETASISFTIPEGWRISQMASALAKRGWFSGETFHLATRVVDYTQFNWLPPEISSLEGFLFPDTYFLPVDYLLPSRSETEKAQTLVSLMVNHFARVALPLYEENKRSTHPTNLSLKQWVTLASIVEKEAVVDEERALIAGVFVNRLNIGMPLGADPTVEYGLNIRQTPDRPLTWAEVRRPSPYNTYINTGLPPGPIASPGLASLKATLDPAETEMLFFVARYDGTHVFSRTLAEHEAAQRKIHRERRERS
jgi:UPF0755 protein